MEGAQDLQTTAAWVVVSKDAMEARVGFTAEDTRPTYEAMVRALAENKVVFGLDEALMHRIAASGQAGEYVIARGTPTTAPTDGRVDFFFRTGGRVLTPNLLADGKVDFRDLGAFELVEEEQILARRQLPVPGQPGRNVLGDEIPARVPRDAPVKGGRGTTMSDDGMFVAAAIRGQPILHRGVIMVNPNLKIEGDVDYGTGNVDFDGSVEILGEVKRNFTVKATGAIYIHGAVEGALIEAGGTLVVAGGARAGAHLVSASNMRARYIEYSRVVCGGHLLVTDDLMFSHVECGGTIEVQGGLVGGTVEADISIRAESLGSRLGTHTELLLRPRFKWQHKIKEAEAEVEPLRERIEAIETAVRDARARQHDDSDGTLVKLSLAAEQLRAELAAATGRLMAAQKRYQALGHPRIFVQTVIHSGVKVDLNGTIAKFDDDQLCTTAYEEAGQIRVA